MLKNSQLGKLYPIHCLHIQLVLSVQGREFIVAPSVLVEAVGFPEDSLGC